MRVSRKMNEKNESACNLAVEITFATPALPVKINFTQAVQEHDFVLTVYMLKTLNGVIW